MVLFESGMLIIGNKIMSTIINDTSNKAVSVIETAIIHEHTDVHQLFIELDLEVRLAVIESLIRSVNTEDDAVKLCIKALYDVITELNSNMKSIEESINEHKEKYFNSWRTLNLDDNIIRIKHNSELLEKRFTLFTDVSTFHK